MLSGDDRSRGCGTVSGWGAFFSPAPGRGGAPGLRGGSGRSRGGGAGGRWVVFFSPGLGSGFCGPRSLPGTVLLRLSATGQQQGGQDQRKAAYQQENRGADRDRQRLLRGRMMGDLQVGLGFRLGSGQQPSTAPEAPLEQQTPEPVDAVEDHADGSRRTAPRVPIIGSQTPGRHDGPGQVQTLPHSPVR